MPPSAYSHADGLDIGDILKTPLILRTISSAAGGIVSYHKNLIYVHIPHLANAFGSRLLLAKATNTQVNTDSGYDPRVVVSLAKPQRMCLNA